MRAVALSAVLTVGLLAGCGEETTSTSFTTSIESSDTAGETANGQEVYDACIERVGDSNVALQGVCANAASAFDRCLQEAQASSESGASETAVEACRAAADQTVGALKPGG